MGIIARTVETSQFALDIRTIMDNLPGRFILGPADQPHAVAPYESMLERAGNIVNDLAAGGEGKYSDEGFAARHGTGSLSTAAPVTDGHPEAANGTLVQVQV